MKRRITIAAVHGWATDSSVWEGFLKHMGAGFNVVNLNLPGHGNKANDDGWDSPSFKPGRDFLLRGIERQRPGPVIGVGWSLGAGLLIDCAAQGLFDAIVLVGATPCFVKRPDFSFAQPGPLARRMIMDIKKDPAAALKRFYGLNFTEEELLTGPAKAFIERFNGLSGGFGRDDLANALQALCKTDLRDALPMINAPTLVVHGSLDSVCPAGAGRFLADNIKDARLVQFEGSGHALFVTRPKDFAGEVSVFIEGLGL